MRSLVEHVPSGLILDFADPDFGGPDQLDVIRAWQDRGHHALHKGEFICDFHRNHEHAAVYLRQDSKTNEITASHYAGFRCKFIHRGVTPEHQRQVEYVGRASEGAGFEVRREVTLISSAGKVRADAVIYGGRVTMSAEVQRSHLTVTAAKGRTTKARRAGVEPVWFADSHATPGWFGYVPSVRMNPDTSWAALPGQRTVTVTSGVRSLVPRRCRDFYNSQCPRRSRGCSAWHADHEPLPLWVDDLAEQMPAGALVPVRFLTLSGREQVLIFTEADKARYEEMAGVPGGQRVDQRWERSRQPDRRLDCVANAGDLLPPRRAPEAAPDLLLFDPPDPAPDHDGRRFTR